MKITTITTVISSLIWVLLAKKTNTQSWGDLEWIAFSLSVFLFLIAGLLGLLIDTTIGAVEVIEKSIKDK